MNIREGFTFDDVLLVPQHGVLTKRADADISGRVIEGFSIEIPILSAPMASVTEDRMAVALSDEGAMGILHRFNSIEEQCAMFDNTQDPSEHMFTTRNVACAIGIHDGLERTYKLALEGAQIFVLDVAHAHTEPAMKMVRSWITSFPDSYLSLIVGNIATREAAYDFAQIGVDGVKVGIGPGAACTTRTVTGFGVPQLTAIMDVKGGLELDPHITLIADGGIKNSGDAVKALAAGADTVMIGSLLAGADEAPYPGEYFGMASHRVNGHHAPEGIEGHVERTGPVADTIEQLAWGIRSAISYGGATNLSELRDNAEFIRCSSQSQIETLTRIS